MTKLESGAVKKTLAASDVHDKWKRDYRSAENQRFYEAAFDYIVRILAAPAGATILDAGCGTCAHSIRLARHGFQVVAVDFSDVAVQEAAERVRESGLEDKIALQREDLTSLTFEDASFEYVLCWGVLMHIPDVEKAMSELARVTKPGGMLVISEGNMYSLEAIALRAAKRILPRGEKAELKRVPAGLERWAETPAGTLVTREADVRWLMRRFEELGFTVVRRAPGQFTELYTRMPSRLLKKLIHGLNMLWFKCVKLPHPAFANILILQKNA